MDGIAAGHIIELNQPAGDVAAPVEYRYPPARFHLATTETHVWRAELDAPSWYVRALESVLSSDERIRASQFVFRRERERYIVGRGQLRMLLGRYLSKPPAALRFSYNACGKPKLEDAGTSELSFNVAHTRGLALYAIARGQQIGVDVEYTGADGVDDGAYEEVARRFFSPHEYRALCDLPAAMRCQAFFRCWVRKEAYVKGLGTGLSLAPTTFDVSVDPRVPAALVRSPLNIDDGSTSWTLYDLAPGPGHVAALAVQGYSPTPKIRQWLAVWS